MNESIMTYLKQKAQIVDEEIYKLFPSILRKNDLERLLGKPTYTYDVESLNLSLCEPFYNFMNRGGKRWRPILMMLAYEALTGKPGDEIKNITPLLEIIHNGTIIIDDIEDNSQLRRNKPCLHLIYGVDIAINVGNFMYFMPFRILHDNHNKFNNNQILRLYNVFIEEITLLHAGQAMDILWHKSGKSNITETDYLQMCAYKTGVLPRLAMKVGAILSESNESIITQLGQFGESIGVAFQIQDDILNITENRLSQMKGLGEDIHEGKRTLMILHVMDKGDESDKNRLLHIINSHTENPEDIAEAIYIINKYDAINYVSVFAKTIVKRSLHVIEKLLTPSKAKQLLIEFADYLISRDI